MRSGCRKPPAFLSSSSSARKTIRAERKKPTDWSEAWSPEKAARWAPKCRVESLLVREAAPSPPPAGLYLGVNGDTG